MEDISKFLLIAGAIVIGIIQYVRKEAKKNAEKETNVPTFDYEDSFDQPLPAPENSQGNTYGGYIPEGPPPRKAEKRAKAKTLAHPYIDDSPKGGGTIRPSQQSTLAPDEEPDALNEANPFAIDSEEEARRAIVWSEILRPKY